MLPKRNRLSRADFQSKTVAQRSFAFGSLKFIDTPAKIAVVVSKKIARTAPVRNLVRRRIYAIIRPLLKAQRITSGLIVYPNKKAIAATHSELKEGLEKAFRKA